MKIIKNGEEARERLKKGVSAIAEAVTSTLGAAGRGVIIDEINGNPYITADGITVAEAFELEAPVEQTGVALVKNVCREANSESGDGTTTAICLADAMLTMDASVKGYSPLLVKKGMDIALEKVLYFLDQQKRDIESPQQLIDIATISARNDRALGKLLAEAFEFIGKDGEILIEENRKSKDEVEFITGYNINRGYWMDSFINNDKRQLCELQDIAIILTDAEITEANVLHSMLEKLITDGQKNIVVIAQGMADKPLLMFQTNITRGAFNGCFIQAPEFGEKQTKFLEDMGVFLGCKPILTYRGDSLSEFAIDKHVGHCERFVASKVMSVFINPQTTKETIDEYIKTLDETDEFTKQRVSKLSGRLAKLTVSANSPVEMREKLDRLEDSKNAIRAALNEGFIPGGGIALLRVSETLRGKEVSDIEAINAGYNLVVNSLSAPLEKILSNLFGEDIDKIETILQKIEKSTEFDFGYDVKNVKFVNMYEAGIIDPVKVTKSSLKAAHSVVSTILNTNVIIAITGENGDLVL